jgi:YD repeat-containing protein
VTEEIVYNDDGSVSRRTEREYNEQGTLKRETTYDGEGSLVYHSEYSNFGETVKKRYLDGWGNIYWEEYEYDNQGNQTKCITYNSDSSVKEWVEYIYE